MILGIVGEGRVELGVGICKDTYRPNKATFSHQMNSYLNSRSILMKGMTYVTGFWRKYVNYYLRIFSDATEPNLAKPCRMVIGWSPFQIVSDSRDLNPRWQLLKIEISWDSKNDRVEIYTEQFQRVALNQYLTIILSYFRIWTTDSTDYSKTIQHINHQDLSK